MIINPDAPETQKYIDDDVIVDAEEIKKLITDNTMLKHSLTSMETQFNRIINYVQFIEAKIEGIIP